MTDLASHLATLRRPRILVRAARIAQTEYDRARMLRHLLVSDHLPPSGDLVGRLLVEEEDLNRRRKSGEAYSASRHIELLAALMAEARIEAARNAA